MNTKTRGKNGRAVDGDSRESGRDDHARHAARRWSAASRTSHLIARLQEDQREVTLTVTGGRDVDKLLFGPLSINPPAAAIAVSRTGTFEVDFRFSPFGVVGPDLLTPVDNRFVAREF